MIRTIFLLRRSCRNLFLHYWFLREPSSFRIARRFAHPISVLFLCLVSMACAVPPSLKPALFSASPLDRDLKSRLAEKAAVLQRLLESRHLSPEGLLIYRRARPVEITGPWKPLAELPSGSYGNLSDAAAWTGCYLAAQAFRSKVTGETHALHQVRLATAALSLLTDITGVVGLYGRTFDRGVGPADYEREHHEWRQGTGSLSSYRYRGNVSKDQYAAMIFGLSTAHDLVDDRQIRRSCRRQLRGIADHLLGNNLQIVDVDGERTRFGDLRGWMLCVPIGVNALISLAAIDAAANATGDRKYIDGFRGLAEKGYIDAAVYAKVQAFGKTNHNNDVMGILSIYTILRHGRTPSARARLLEGLERTFAIVGHERNALYNGIYSAIGPSAPDLIGEALDTLDRFPSEKIARPIDLTTHPGLGRSPFKNRHGIRRAAISIPMNLRPMTSFVWRSCPYGLIRKENETVRTSYAGCDYLVAYWLMRYHGLVEGPSSLETESTATPRAILGDSKRPNIYINTWGQ